MNHDLVALLREDGPNGFGWEEPGGSNPLAWWNEFSLGSQPPILPDGPVSRDFIINARKRNQLDVLGICVCAAAWGGMRNDHARKFFKAANLWRETAEEIYRGDLTRSEAYAKLRNLQREGTLPGMGPAYYTKLIYFLMPRTPAKPIGYIMDQWSGGSVNLLFGGDIVLMDETYTWKKDRRRESINSAFTVSNFNDEENYENFCLRVEEVAASLKIAPDEAEAFMFSRGGRNPQRWRTCVKKGRERAAPG